MTNRHAYETTTPRDVRLVLPAARGGYRQDRLAHRPSRGFATVDASLSDGPLRGFESTEPSHGAAATRSGQVPRTCDLVVGIAAHGRGCSLPRSSFVVGLERPPRVAALRLVSRRPARRRGWCERTAIVPRSAVPDGSGSRGRWLALPGLPLHRFLFPPVAIEGLDQDRRFVHVQPSRFLLEPLAKRLRWRAVLAIRLGHDVQTVSKSAPNASATSTAFFKVIHP